MSSLRFMGIDKYWKMQPNKGLAWQFAVRLLPQLLFDAAGFQGLKFTLVEIMTLLDGVTVGGYEVAEQDFVLNQAAEYKTIFDLIKKQGFEADPPPDDGRDIYETAYTALLLQNKFVMTSILLDAGYPIFSTPADRKQEFKKHLKHFRDTGDNSPAFIFLRSCMDLRFPENFKGQ